MYMFSFYQPNVLQFFFAVNVGWGIRRVAFGDSAFVGWGVPDGWKIYGLSRLGGLSFWTSTSVEFMTTGLSCSPQSDVVGMAVG